MSKLHSLCALLLATLAFCVQAAPTERYEDARHACDKERNNGQRKKCMRDLERNYPAAAQHKAQAACPDCAKVLGVRVEKRKGDSNALGVVAGGAAGALLGNQVGGGNGKTLATIAGAVGGAYAGKKIQEKSNESTIWIVDVEYENGRRASFSFDRDPALQRGDHVQNAGQSIRRI